jgi:hypothetical protein
LVIRRFNGALSRQIVNLTASRCESVLDRYLSMFVRCSVSCRMIDNDVLVRRNRQPNVHLKFGAMAMLVAWSNNGYAASRNALIVCFQSFDLF